MVRGPRARAVPKSKVMPEDGETLKAAMKAEKNGKLMNGNGSHQLLPPNPRKRGRNNYIEMKICSKTRQTSTLKKEAIN